MNSHTQGSAVDRARRNSTIVIGILSYLEPPDVRRSRSFSREMNADARWMLPRCADGAECESRLRERFGPSDDPKSMERHCQRTGPPTSYDKNVLAVSLKGEPLPYTLPQYLKVYPELETFYTDGVIVDRLTDRLWLMRSDMEDTADRTAAVEKLSNEFFSHQAVANCPEVPLGSALLMRNSHRLERLKKRDDMKGSRYYRFTTLSPVNGPRDLLREDSATTHNIWAFGRLIQAHTSHSWGVAHSIDTIEYAPRTNDRLKLYRRLARHQFPQPCHGNTTVILSSPDRAPNYSDIVANDTFPGELRNMKHLIVDASIGSVPESTPNLSSAYASPHLESVTFRLHDTQVVNASTNCVSGVVPSETNEVVEQQDLPSPEDLAGPLYGCSARIIFSPGPKSLHLTSLCQQATSAASTDRATRSGHAQASE